MGPFNFTLRSQALSLVCVNQARTTLADNVLRQTPSPTPSHRTGRLPLIDVIGKGHFTGRVLEQCNVKVLREQQFTDDAMQCLK
ncbi:hypothetical protein D3C84_427260 [compost metagenome]